MDIWIFFQINMSNDYNRVSKKSIAWSSDFSRFPQNFEDLRSRTRVWTGLETGEMKIMFTVPHSKYTILTIISRYPTVP